MEKQLTNFIFELGMLKTIRHEGWRMAGITDPETVAAHSLRAAQIAYILAVMEKNAQPEAVATMLLFHDIGECRMGDIHSIAKVYITADEAQAVSDQIKPLGDLGHSIEHYWKAIEEQSSPEGIIAKDADLLEQAFTAKEYIETGYPAAIDWIVNVEKILKTAGAKALMQQLKKTSSTEWWQGLKHVHTKA
ncbi:HD domain-containing protein [Candidatus Woesearchaeota archaeon]|nr:HD domain-containing protein [Candidatus Woesearchaeota archaeon]HIH38501.1 HD domain-containing protein [Candidatus Woesearchaeota archaeon]HIH48210.1 HD domain-containing protein [Candidatus Woesearchaeota archaeon]HIJ04459.1 HD domain-containing protein [Candidatus Woesearchaeota archaeon]